MTEASLEGARILVVGGAGFVGSNLVRALLEDHSPAEIVVVDNLLSSERENVPDDPAISFIEGSITEDATLARLPRDLDFVFHLATYHGNQSSMVDPLADHEHNTFSTLRLYEAIKGHRQPRARRLRIGRVHRGREDVRRRCRPQPRTPRSRCGSTARTRSRRSSASTTRTTTSPGTACRR